MNFTELSAEFPRDAVSWRSQSLTRNGDKALALAYIDARDVMERLDDVCGPGNWQDSYTETAKGRVICVISIKIGEEWIGKSDGAGDTAVEGDKGGISDAFKRAAVKWGIGRYLYALGSPWVPCDTYERNGKKVFSKFTADPWNFIRGSKPEEKTPPKETASKAASRTVYETLQMAVRECEGMPLDKFDEWKEKQRPTIMELPKDWRDSIAIEINSMRETLAAQAAQQMIGS